jgi:hypothetical protein
MTCLAIWIGASASADEVGHPLPLWQVNSEQNRIYLLGSIHLLREQDYPIPSAIYDAYENAEILIMELDMDDMDPAEGQALTKELGMIQDDRTLSDLMGSELYGEAETLAAAAQIPIALLAKSEPWYAAMTVEIMLLMRMGFNPQYGIETHFMNLAADDGKEILGFETMRQQLELLDGLSPEVQRDMLIQALAEGIELHALMDPMIDAWSKGDMTFIADNLLADIEDYPEINQAIVVDRNIDWTNQIVDLLNDNEDYLVIVGTLHLVGDQGVPNLLQSRDYEVKQLRQHE